MAPPPPPSTSLPADRPATPPTMPAPLSDLVEEFKIETSWASPDGVHLLTTHVRTAPGPSARLRQRRVEETWHRRTDLGSGAYGRVWVEERVAPQGGDDRAGRRASRFRAVKEVRKGRDWARPAARPDHLSTFLRRELEAVAKFSQDKVCHVCFPNFGCGLVISERQQLTRSLSP